MGLSIRKTETGGHRAPASEDSIRPEAISVAGVLSGCLAAALLITRGAQACMVHTRGC